MSDATERLYRAQVEPWNFMRQRLRVEAFGGKSISYEGIEFEGSPRLVFWSRYIEPFLEDLAVKELAAAVALAKEREVDGRELLVEVQGLLLSACRSTLERMAEIDRRLLGRGFPASIPLRSIEPEYAVLQEFIDRQVQAELAMWKRRPAYERWYEQNKFLVWVLGTVVTIAGLAAKFL